MSVTPDVSHVEMCPYVVVANVGLSNHSCTAATSAVLVVKT